jgi:uncharacterized protein
MAATLYLASLEAYSGKTAMSVALGLEFKERGLSVGYMKPLGTLPVEIGGLLSDEDCVFVTQALGIDEPLGRVCPILMTPDLMEEPIKGPVTGVREQIIDSYNQVSKGRDVVIVEGSATLADGYALGVATSYLASATDAKVLLITRYQRGLNIDEILMAKDTLGDRLIGVLVNSVPQEVKPYVRAQFPAFLNRHGMTSYGILPVDKVLMAITIGELVGLLDGELLCCRDKVDDLVENFAVGAMNVDAALKYFLRMPNKAVITGGDRADIQLAALQTSTKVMILTGNLHPDAIILGRAMELGVPVVVVKADTMRAVELVEKALGRIRLTSPRQIDRLQQIVKREVDLPGLYAQLGL